MQTKIHVHRTFFILMTALVFTGAAFFLSLCTGKYPLSLTVLFSGNEAALRVFQTLRLPRTVMALCAGFCLGCAGMVYQIIFQNPLASPDIIGVSSGASVGAASAILFFHASPAGITGWAFAGALSAVFLAFALTSLTGQKNLATMVLSGIAVNALAQSVLMMLKFTADPEKELASIEYWIMGSLGSITASKIPVPLIVSASGIFLLFFFCQKMLLLSLSDDEARTLGVPVTLLRLFLLSLATLVVAATVSVTGLISFIGLLAPHTARLLLKTNGRATLFLSGLLGSALLLTADLIARSTATELPVSILTSVLGAPFLLWILFREGRT
jgi:iron complex transport system permease protein